MQAKFLVPILITTVAFSVAAIYWIPGHVENLLLDELTRRGELAAETLDKSAIGALVVNDAGALHQLANGFIRSSEILYVVILDKDGKKLADSGVDPRVYARIERLLPQILKREGSFVTKDEWPPSGESLFHIARPVFYEQLRIGTIMVGTSARRATLTRRQLSLQVAIFCTLLVAMGVLAGMFGARSLSKPLQQIAAGIGEKSNEQLEVIAGKVKEFNFLVESIEKNKNLFQNSLREIESHKIQLENDLAAAQEENNSLSSKLTTAQQQFAGLQESLKKMEDQSKHLAKLLPLVQFASGVAPEIDSSMQYVTRSAERLREDLERIKNLIELYEKAPPPAPQDREVIRQYKQFINYEQIMRSIDELVSTIRGGASWTEQLADLLKQLSVGDLTKVK